MTNGDNGMTQGARANANGKIGEDMLVPLFEGNGYKVVLWGEYNKSQRKAECMSRGTAHPREPITDFDKIDKLVIKQYPYNSIYGHQGKTEFLIINRLKNRRIRVEVKWQQSAGSVDEKFPYVWLNAVFAFEEKEIIVIIDGDGYKQGAREWIVEQAKNRWLLNDDDKSIEIMTIPEFIAFFNNELR